jgi:hypothetical protein
MGQVGRQVELIKYKVEVPRSMQFDLMVSFMFCECFYINVRELRRMGSVEVNQGKLK